MNMINGCGGSCCNQIDVLDKGFVRLVDHSGGDLSVVQAARVSTGNGSKGPDSDRKLIAYLMANKHGTPFEHNLIKFHVKAPIFVARQWFRHRIGQSYNEMSARYSEVPGEWYNPSVWRMQAKDNKQGSSVAEIVEGQVSCANYDMACRAAYNVYQSLLRAGVTREQARMVLPQSMYTEWYWTVNARSLMAFLALRLDEHAQWEIRQYAEALYDLWEKIMPETAKAFIENGRASA